MEIKNINGNELKIIDFRESKEAVNLIHDEQMQYLYFEKNKIVLSKNESLKAEVFFYDIVTSKLDLVYAFEKNENAYVNFTMIDLDNIAYSVQEDDQITHRIYNLKDELLILDLKTINEESLFLNRNFVLLRNSEEAFTYDETWEYNAEKDFLYLYDISTNTKYEIFEKRLKNSWLSSNNYFIKNVDGLDMLFHVPFDMEPYEAEELFVLDKLNTNKSIYSVNLEELFSFNKELSLNVIHTCSESEYYFAYGDNNYALYDFAKNSIQKFQFDDQGEIIFSNNLIDYSLIASSYNFAMIDDQFVYHGDGLTVFLTMDMHEMDHGIRDSFLKRIGNLYVFTSWSEDSNGDNYEEFLIIRDVSGKILLKESAYAQIIEKENILILQ